MVFSTAIFAWRTSSSNVITMDSRPCLSTLPSQKKLQAGRNLKMNWPSWRGCFVSVLSSKMATGSSSTYWQSWAWIWKRSLSQRMWRDPRMRVRRVLVYWNLKVNVFLLQILSSGFGLYVQLGLTHWYFLHVWENELPAFRISEIPRDGPHKCHDPTYLLHYSPAHRTQTRGLRN